MSENIVIRRFSIFLSDICEHVYYVFEWKKMVDVFLVRELIIRAIGTIF